MAAGGATVAPVLPGDDHGDRTLMTAAMAATIAHRRCC